MNVDLESGKSTPEITGNDEKIATANLCQSISHEEQKSKTEARLKSITTMSQSQKATGSADVLENPQVTEPGQTIPMSDKPNLLNSNRISKSLNTEDDRTHATDTAQPAADQDQIQSQVSSTVQMSDKIRGTICHESDSSVVSVIIENPKAVFPSSEDYSDINQYLKTVLTTTRNIIQVVNNYNISRKDENEDYEKISVICIHKFVTDSDLKKYNNKDIGRETFVHDFISNVLEKNMEVSRKNYTINAIKVL